MTRLAVNTCTAVIIKPIIRTPFPQVAVHVIQPECIGRITAHRAGAVLVNPGWLVRKNMVAAVIGQPAGQRRSTGKGRGIPPAAGIFPLGFGWQPERQMGLLGQFLAKSGRIFP